MPILCWVISTTALSLGLSISLVIPVLSLHLDSPIVEIAADDPPYRGVRGRGLARLEFQPPEDILRLLIQRYLDDEESSLARWLLGRRSSEVTIRVVPSHLHSWDYTRRMTGR